jgi:hypothetical protein
VRAAPFVFSCVAAIALVAVYVALGGTSYEPTPVANPCTPRPTQPATGTDEQLEHVVLAAADTAACSLGVSREDLVLALRSVDDLDRLAERTGHSRGDLEHALRDGLVRAVAQAQSEGLIGGRTASGLRFAAEHLPLGLLLSVLREASSLLN